MKITTKDMVKAGESNLIEISDIKGTDWFQMFLDEYPMLSEIAIGSLIQAGIEIGISVGKRESKAELNRVY